MAVNFNLLRQAGPANFAEGLMQGQDQQNALLQQQQQRQLSDIQLRNALRGEQEAMAESEAVKGSASLEDLAGRYRKAGLGKQALATEAALAKQRTDKLAAAKSQFELLKTSATRIMSNPTAAVSELQRYQQLTGVDMSDDIAQVQSMAPEAIKQWAAGHALEADKLLPQFETSNLGGAVQRQGYDRITGMPIGQAVSTPMQPLPVDVEAQKSRIAKSGAPNVTVSTEKKYGERFGGLIADQDAAKLSAAENAPNAAETADRVMDLISTGKVITGTGANARLQIAKALNLAGGTDSEKIRNTEVLVSSLAETTLGAIKSSNLGAGQGFTNADRDFLEKAKAGQLSYDAKSLTELARLSRLAAEKSAQSWNKRVQQIPAAALEGTGISTQPVVVPPRKTSSVMNIPQGAIDLLKSGAGTREQFDAQFGPGSANRVLPKGN